MAACSRVLGPGLPMSAGMKKIAAKNSLIGASCPRSTPRSANGERESGQECAGRDGHVSRLQNEDDEHGQRCQQQRLRFQRRLAMRGAIQHAGEYKRDERDDMRPRAIPVCRPAPA